MTTTTERIRQATALLASVVADGAFQLDDHSLVEATAELETAGRLLDTGRALLAAEIDDRSRWQLGRDGLSVRIGGQRKPAQFLETLTRASQAEVQRRIRLGRGIRQRTGMLGELLEPAYPHLASAMTSGTLGTDAAAAVLRTLDLAARRHASPDDLVAAERSLVEAGATSPADLVRIRAGVWLVALDPDGVEGREEAVHERRSASLSREVNGVTILTVTCGRELAATLRSAFGAATRPGAVPVFLSEAERRRGLTDEGELIDPRTREQIQHDTLLGLVTAGLRSTGREPGQVKPLTSVVATVHLRDLLAGAGVGHIEGSMEPVSRETIEQLICDGGFRKLVLGANDEPLFLGSTERLFSPAQRKARAVIDGGCVMPWCNAPPSWTQMHHVLEVKADNGPTDISNGVLLCAADHHFLHHSEYRMKMVDSRPYLLPPPAIDPSQTWIALGRSAHLQTLELERQRKAG